MTDVALDNAASAGDAQPTANTAGDGGNPETDEINVVSGAEHGVAKLATEAVQSIAAVVKGHINVEDDVVEKVAGLAAIEVDGVADLGGDMERAIESVRERVHLGRKRETQGAKAVIDGKNVSLEMEIVIEFGHVVTEVAKAVKANVARQVNQMLRLRVVEVDVKVTDVRMPEADKQPVRSREPQGYGDVDDDY